MEERTEEDKKKKVEKEKVAKNNIIRLRRGQFC